MIYKKNNLIKLIKLIDEISNQAGNEWFKNELDKKVTKNSSVVISAEIDDIYEYCIKLILKDHAEKFYADFKLLDIKEKLIEDFIRMEKFRRDDNFEDFCLAAYQQLESIISKLVTNSVFVEYFRQNKDTPALLKFDFDTQAFVRKGNQTIGKLIFLTGDNTKINNFLSGPVNNWYFNHKFRAVLYLFYFNKEIKNNTDSFDRIYSIGNSLYQGRNLNHRGAVQSQYQQDVIDDLIPNQHKYYFRFLGFLEEFITSINNYI
jgi:hypothetical protein